MVRKLTTYKLDVDHFPPFGLHDTLIELKDIKDVIKSYFLGDTWKYDFYRLKHILDNLELLLLSRFFIDVDGEYNALQSADLKCEPIKPSDILDSRAWEANVTRPFFWMLEMDVQTSFKSRSFSAKVPEALNKIGLNNTLIFLPDKDGFHTSSLLYNVYSDLVEKFNFCGNIYRLMPIENLHVLVFYRAITLIIKQTEQLLPEKFQGISSRMDIMKLTLLDETSKKEKAEMATTMLAASASASLIPVKTIFRKEKAKMTEKETFESLTSDTDETFRKENIELLEKVISETLTSEKFIEIARNIDLYHNKISVGYVGSQSYRIRNYYVLKGIESELKERILKDVFTQFESEIEIKLSRKAILHKRMHIADIMPLKKQLHGGGVIQYVFNLLLGLGEVQHFFEMLSVGFFSVDVNSTEWRDKVAINLFKDVDAKKEEMEEIFMDTLADNFEKKSFKENLSKNELEIFYLKQRLVVQQEKLMHSFKEYVYGFEDFEKDLQMREICCNFLSKFGTDVKSVWPGKRDKEDVLVTFTKAKVTTIPKSFPSLDKSRNYTVLQKIYGQEPEEEKILFGKEKDRGTRMARETRKLIRNVINKHSKMLMQRHSNLTVISPSNFVSHENGQRIETKPCIVLYCTFKGVLPLGEANFPKMLDGYVVDVREGLAIPCGSQNYCDPLCMGCSIGLEGRKSAGSIGLFVQEKDSKQTHGFITCFHVLFGSDLGLSDSAKSYIAALGQQQYTVVQESDEDVQESVEMTDVNNSLGQISNVPELRSSSLRQCGIVRDVILGISTVAFDGELIDVGVDAAFIEITSRNPCVPKFAERDGDKRRGTCICDYPIGDIMEEVTEEDEDHAIYKFGRTSKFTKGLFESFGDLKMYKDMSDLDKGFTYLPNQYQILSTYEQPFLELGDSGSAVFMKTKDHKLHCIGIGVSKSQPGGKYAFVTPIKAVLKALQPKLEARTFQATGNGSISSNGQ